MTDFGRRGPPPAHPARTGLMFLHDRWVVEMLEWIAATLGDLAQKETNLMAITQDEQDAISQLTADIDAAFTAALQAQQANIASLTAQVGDLTTKLGADDATVQQLNATIAQMQTDAAAASSGVVAAIQAVDSHVSGLGATPTSTTTAAPVP